MIFKIICIDIKFFRVNNELDIYLQSIKEQQERLWNERKKELEREINAEKIKLKKHR